MISPAAARTEVNPTTVWGVRYETGPPAPATPRRGARPRGRTPAAKTSHPATGAPA